MSSVVGDVKRKENTWWIGAILTLLLPQDLLSTEDEVLSSRSAVGFLR